MSNKDLLNATEISEMIGMNKTKILTLIKNGILPVAEEKEVKFKGKYITVRYVNKEIIDSFIRSDIYIDYINKKEKRDENKKQKEIIKKEIRMKEIEKFIKDFGGITDELIGKVAYCYSKRAKFYNQFRDYDAKDEMYEKKDFILNLYKPLEIHLNKRHIKYYDFPNDYYVQEWEKDEFIVEKDVIDVLEFYKIGDCSFHKPIRSIENLDELENIDINKNLPINKIELNSKFIDNLDQLLDLDICDYVIEKLKNREYIYELAN